jgi:integrase
MARSRVSMSEREAAWREAFDHDAAGLLPSERYQLWRRTGRRPSPVVCGPPSHIGAFLDHVADDRLNALYHVIAFQGLRRSEACGQRWNDTDLDQAWIAVQGDPAPDAALVARDHDGHLHIGVPGDRPGPGREDERGGPASPRGR